MTEIIIGNAPPQYQKYLKLGDNHAGPKGNDGKINDPDEAETAAEQFCGAEDRNGCDKFLEYLGNVGYPLVNRWDYAGMEKYYFSAVENIIGKETFEQIGSINIKKISEAAGKDANAAFIIIREEFVKEGLLKNNAVKLVEIAQAAGKYTFNAYFVLAKLSKRGLIEKYGIDQVGSLIIEIAMAVGKYTPDAYYVLAKLLERGLVEKHGLDQVQSFLVEVAKVGKEDAGEVYSILANMADEGLIEKYGINKIKNFLTKTAKMAGDEMTSTFAALKKIVQDGLFEKYGIEQILSLFKQAALVGSTKTFLMLNKLVQAGLLQREGINRIKALFSEARRSSKQYPSTIGGLSLAFGRLAELEDDFVRKIGVATLIEIIRSESDSLSNASVVEVIRGAGLMNRQIVFAPVRYPGIGVFAQKRTEPRYDQSPEVLAFGARKTINFKSQKVKGMVIGLVVCFDAMYDAMFPRNYEAKLSVSIPGIKESQFTFINTRKAALFIPYKSKDGKLPDALNLKFKQAGDYRAAAKNFKIIVISAE